MPPVHTLYIILRRDLITALNWPLGALVAQGCHATSAVLHQFRDDSNVVEYLADLERMRKVVVEVSDEANLRKIADTLATESKDFHLWIEQPENVATCLAVKPYPKKEIHKYLKDLPLFS